MAVLAQQFRTALHRIEPEDDAKNAAHAYEQVTMVLKADERLVRLGVSPVLIGSYGRHVSIKRVKDVDVFIRLVKATSSLRPGDILDHVVAVLAAAFPGRVERQHRSAKVAFDDYDLSVDVVVARPCVDHPNDHWQIPQRIDEQGNARWIETNPTKMGELTTAANKQFLLSEDDDGSGIYVPTVKLVRQIRRTWVDDQPGGYYFEVLTYHAFQDLQPSENTVADYLTRIVTEIAERLPDYSDEGPADPTLDGLLIRTKATTEQVAAAADRFAAAADLATRARKQTDPCKSAVLWQRLLGQTHHTSAPEHVFPLPDYCNEDGTTKAASGIERGAAAVPAGSDRYA